MARLWQSGFELNSTTANMEFTALVGAPTIQTTTVRTGTYAGKSVAGTGASKAFQYTFSSANANGPYFLRVYFNFSTLPNSDDRIVSFLETGGTQPMDIVFKSASNKLQMEYNNAGTAPAGLSSVIAINTWYRLELKFDKSGAAGAHIVEAKLDGTAFSTVTNATITNGINQIQIGTNNFNDTDTSGVIFYDDIAINDSTGSNQTSYPGAGSITHTLPNGNGETTQWTIAGSSPAATNWQGVKEVTPDDGVTFNKDSSSVNTDDIYTLASSGLGASDTITLVAVGLRYRMGAVASGLHVKLETQSSGTKQDSGALNNGAQNTWSTNSQASPRNYPLVAYTDPQGGGSWTTTLVNSARINIHNSGGSNESDVSTVWLSIDSIPAAGGAFKSKLLTLLGVG